MSTEYDVELAELQFMREHLAQRARICYGMVAAGVICLAAGAVMLAIGLKGDQVIWFQSGTIKITAGGFGAVTMLASVAWGYAAYRSRPEIKYDSPHRNMELTEPTSKWRRR
jgi:hypothetical protein